MLIFGWFPIDISAQTAVKDTTLNRQVYLEREYTPTIQDASKINTLPALHQPQKKQYDIRFENATPQISFASYRVGDSGAGDIQTTVDYSKHRGYFSFGAGMYTNLEGALGYRIVDAKNDRLDLFATHSFTDANVKYLEDKYVPHKVKAKDMENRVKLRYKHHSEDIDWYLGASFLNDQYNYYGNPFLTEVEANMLERGLEEKQSVSNIEIETGIQSKETEELTYSGSIRYNRFMTKYGPDITYDGASANLVNAHVDLLFPFMDEFKAGVRGGVFYQGADKVDFTIGNDIEPFHSLTVFNANPYIAITSDNLLISMGVNLSHAFDVVDKSQIAPTVNVNWNFEERSMFYLSADGGINDNNLLYIFRENKYVNPSDRVAISRTPYNVKGGIKSGVIKGFEFDIFGGYKYTKNQHLYIQGNTPMWYNVSDVIYADMGTGHFGASLKTKLIPYTDLSLAGTGFFYHVKEYTGYDAAVSGDKKAFGLPALQLALNADFTFVKDLILSANYVFEGGRKTYFSDVKNMNAINELSFKANYSLLDWLSVYAKANNVLNQKYERYYGYTLQGINMLIGINLKF